MGDSDQVKSKAVVKEEGKVTEVMTSGLLKKVIAWLMPPIVVGKIL